MKILKEMMHDLLSIPDNFLKKYKVGGKINANKLAIDLIPFLFISYFANRFLAGYELSGKEDWLEASIEGAGLMFSSVVPSLHSTPFWGGITAGVAFHLYMQIRKKNAKKFRHGEEYGSARWGTPKDFEPYMDDNKWLNIPLTATEGLRMTKPPHPKYQRNKNMMIIGGSGAGKTRGHVKPTLMQMLCSYVVTDPKGTVLVETGKMLQKGGYMFDLNNGKPVLEFDKKTGKPTKYGNDPKTGKPRRFPYKIKVFNTINVHKSMHYNPFAYIKSEQDVLKFVDTLINNTKGEGNQTGEDFWVKAERLLYCAYVGYLVFECDEEDRNFDSLLYMINASETREDDEEFENAIDLMFKELEDGVKDEDGNWIKEPNKESFALSQYKSYKLAAGKTAKSILISCGARLAPFNIREIRDLTMYDELELGNLGREKTALFVIISDTDSSLNFLVSIMYTQLFNLLCTIADDEYNGKLPVHVHCILDEFANIGQIPQWDKLIATIRSREISAAMILQSKSQLKSIYKDAAETIEGNCDTSLFLGGREKSTLKDLAEILGKETIDTYNKSDTRGTSQTYGQNYQKLGHELMSMDKISQMDRNKCILEVGGVPPFFSDKVDITAHEFYRELSDDNPDNAFDIEKYVKHYKITDEHEKPKIRKGEKVHVFNLADFQGFPFDKYGASLLMEEKNQLDDTEKVS